MKRKISEHITLASLVLLGAFTPAALFISPILVGEMVLKGYSEQHAGLIISAEWVGMLVACIPALWWVKRCNLHRVLYLALLIMIVGNSFSVYIYIQYYHYIEWLYMMRVLSSLGGGTAMCVCLVGCLQMRRPDRVFGLWVSAQLIFGIAGTLLLPSLFDQYNIIVFYLIMVIFALCFTPFTRFLPRHPSELHGLSPAGGADVRKKRAFFSLGALFIYYVGIYCVWPYLERMGINEGLEQSSVNYTLFWALIIGLLGSLTASWIDAKLLRSRAIFVGVLLSISSTLLVGFESSLYGYVIGVCILSYAWNFIIPYLMADVSVLDSSGRYIILSCAMSAAGLFVGSSISAYLVEAQIYQRLILAAVVFYIVSALLSNHPSYFSVFSKRENA